MAVRTDDCGSKHLRLAVAIIGIVIAICSGTIGHSMTCARALDERVRIVEQNDAANAARFEAIQQSLDRLERRVSP